MAIGKKKLFPADSVVECIESHAVQLEGEAAAVYVAGVRLRAGHPAVQKNPSFWIAAGMPHDEIAAQLRDNHAVAAEATPPVERVAPRPRLRAVDAVVSKGHLLPEGTRIARTDARVKANPDAFVPVCPPGLVATDALVALATLRHTDHRDVTHVTYQGQWVHRDDPAVTRHPLQFGLIAPDA